MSVDIRQKPISKERKSLYLDIYENGSRQYEFLRLYLLPPNSTENRQTNKETWKLAEAIRAKRELEVKNEQYGFTAGFKKKANFIQYFEAYKNTRKALQTRQGYETTLKVLKEFAGPVVTFESINSRWIEKFKDFLLNYKVANDTRTLGINSAITYYNRIKAVYHQALRERIVFVDPFKEVKSIPAADTNTEFLELDEIKLLFKTECKKPELKRAFLFCCFTGLRFSDVSKLQWKDIKNNRIEFIQQKSDGRSRVIVPLAETAIELLKDADRTREKIFNLNGISYTEHLLRDWCAKAGINKHITFHVARHTFATLSLTLGADLYTVSKLLGHAKIQTTQKYAKVIDEKKNNAIALLPNLEITGSYKTNKPVYTLEQLKFKLLSELSEEFIDEVAVWELMEQVDFYPELAEMNKKTGNYEDFKELIIKSLKVRGEEV